MGIADTARRIAAAPKELASNQKRDLPQQPQREQNPDPGYQPWSPASDAVESAIDQQRSGLAALARSDLYRQPTADELREQQEQANLLAAAIARQAR